jgi:hypothetical protein
MTNLCDECETVVHCSKHGCIPKRDFWKDYEPEPTRPAPMTTDKALDLALEALKKLYGVLTIEEIEPVDKAITAIKQARSAPVQKRPQNCGTGYCSCIECVMEPAPVQDEDLYDLAVKADNGGQP